MAISLTKRAAEEVKKIMEAQSLAPETVLRTLIVGGGCSGMQYTLGFDTKFDPEIDAKYVSDGVPLVAEKKFALFLDEGSWLVQGAEARALIAQRNKYMNEFISVDVLGAYALDLIGAPLTPFQKARLYARKTMPALNLMGYMDAKGVWHALEDVNGSGGKDGGKADDKDENAAGDKADAKAEDAAGDKADAKAEDAAGDKAAQTCRDMLWLGYLTFGSKV